jgi:hypothetical protein
MHLSRVKTDNPAARIFFSSENNNKNRREMGLLSMSNLAICIKKTEFSDFKA